MHFSSRLVITLSVPCVPPLRCAVGRRSVLRILPRKPGLAPANSAGPPAARPAQLSAQPPSPAPPFHTGFTGRKHFFANFVIRSKADLSLWYYCRPSSHSARCVTCCPLCAAVLQPSPASTHPAELTRVVQQLTDSICGL